jgi:acetyltransferase-like isoleucine patch superfamily enzyme
VTRLLRHAARALREHAAHRRDWLRFARSLPPDGRLAWTALIIGTRISAGPRTSIGGGAVLHAGPLPIEAITIGADCRIHPGARLLTWGGAITLGNQCSVNAESILYGTGGIRIGTGVRIAALSAIVASQHVFTDPQAPIMTQGYTARGIEIEDDVWIGAGACVLDGARIGKGAVIGAGAVVTRHVPPYTVVAGVPAAEIRRRGAPPVQTN